MQHRVIGRQCDLFPAARDQLQRSVRTDLLHGPVLIDRIRIGFSVSRRLYVGSTPAGMSTMFRLAINDEVAGFDSSADHSASLCWRLRHVPVLKSESITSNSVTRQGGFTTALLLNFLGSVFLNKSILAHERQICCNFTQNAAQTHAQSGIHRTRHREIPDSLQRQGLCFPHSQVIECGRCVA